MSDHILKHDGLFSGFLDADDADCKSSSQSAETSKSLNMLHDIFNRQ